MLITMIQRAFCGCKYRPLFRWCNSLGKVFLKKQDKALQEFRALIEEKITKAQNDLELVDGPRIFP